MQIADPSIRRYFRTKSGSARITELLLLRDLGVNLGVPKYSQQLRNLKDRSHRDRVGNWCDL